MKPLLKWAGGKRHIAEAVQKRFPPDWGSGTYFEPFLGGAAMFIHLQPSSAVLGDINPHLIRFYTDVRDAPDLLVSQIAKFAAEFDNQSLDGKKEYFYQLRDKFNTRDETTEHSALMYCLNKLCFNGLYRENAKGGFNVPFGQKKAFPQYAENEFFEFSTALGDAKLVLGDFESVVEGAANGDFVYFDPPYIPVDATSNFTAYSSSGFGPDEQHRLAALMVKLADRGVKAVLSNSATPETSRTYAGLRTETILAPRMVSAKAAGRGSVEEFLIMNF